jgi:AcrR family transcriptional regulator
VSDSSRLSAEDWVDAAFEALMTEGPDAVAVQPLTRAIGATKGSFYWHFSSRDDLLRAALERWMQVTTDDVIEKIDASDDEPTAMARRLLARIANGWVKYPGQLRMLTSEHPDVIEALAQANDRRVDYVATLLRLANFPRGLAARRAALAYATYIGHAHLLHATPEVLPRSSAGRRAFVDEMLRVLIGPEW